MKEETHLKGGPPGLGIDAALSWYLARKWRPAGFRNSQNEVVNVSRILYAAFAVMCCLVPGVVMVYVFTKGFDNRISMIAGAAVIFPLGFLWSEDIAYRLSESRSDDRRHEFLRTSWRIVITVMLVAIVGSAVIVGSAFVLPMTPATGIILSSTALLLWLAVIPMFILWLYERRR